jgi:hypothetical protein
MSEAFASSASMRRSRSTDGNSGSMASFLWRSFVGRRNEDYRGEEHPSPSGTGVVDRNTEGGARASTTPTAAVTSSVALSTRTRDQQQQQQQNRLRRRWNVERFLRSGTWKFFLIVFALVVLFGASIRELFLPKSADLAVDVVFLVAFIFFAIDIVMRIGFEPGYLSCPVVFVVDKNQNDRRRRCVFPRLGSFLFWCDFCSTMTLFYDMSFLNKGRYGEKQLSFEVGPWGDPVRRQQRNRVRHFFPLLLISEPDNYFYRSMVMKSRIDRCRRILPC